jgi:predicted PurR-regulated permease PerM
MTGPNGITEAADDRPENPDAQTPTVAPPVLAFGTLFRWGAAVTLGALTVVILAWGVYAVRDLLVRVVIALFIAISLDPAVRWLIQRGVRRSVAVGLIFGLFLLLLTGFVLSVAPPLISQAANLTRDLPGYFTDLAERSRTYRELADRYGVTQRISDWAAGLPARLGADALGFLQRTLSTLLNALLVIVLTIYFMADLPRLRRGLVRLFPHRRRPRVAQAVNVVVDKVGSYMIGNLIISVFAGVSTFICLLLLDVPFAVPLAVFVAVTDLIPLVGATIGAVGCTVVAFFTGDLWPTVTLVAIFFLVYQQVENYVIVPRVLRNTVNMSSIAVLLAALLGGTLLGVVGALMAIPVAAAVKVLMTPKVEALGEAPQRPAAPPPVIGGP